MEYTAMQYSTIWYSEIKKRQKEHVLHKEERKKHMQRLQLLKPVQAASLLKRRANYEQNSPTCSGRACWTADVLGAEDVWKWNNPKGVILLNYNRFPRRLFRCQYQGSSGTQDRYFDGSFWFPKSPNRPELKYKRKTELDPPLIIPPLLVWHIGDNEASGRLLHRSIVTSTSVHEVDYRGNTK